MINNFKYFICVTLFVGGIHCRDLLYGNTLTSNVLFAAKISPDIVNELKDFEELIPAAKIDAIVAEHYLVDGNFRKALKFVRSSECTRLQSQLLDMPEIIQVLDFLHMTVNATTTTATMVHSNVATDAAARTSSLAVNDNGMEQRTTNAEATSIEAGTGSRRTYAMHPSANEIKTIDALAYKTPQLEELERTMNMNAAFVAELPIVDIVQLEMEMDEDTATLDDDDDIAGHERHQHQHPVGTFTSFVEDIIAQLPHTEYQNMIIQKCQKNAKFADFYRALRSPELKPLVDEVMKSPNVVKIIGTLSANDVDVKSLEPLGFKVISWGPNLKEEATE